MNYFFNTTRFPVVLCMCKKKLWMRNCWT